MLTEQAIADAAEADRKRAAGGNNFRCSGIPIAVKDDVDVAGVPTRFGADGDVRPAAGRRRGGAAAARGGCGHRRQDQHLRTGPVAVHQRAGIRAHPQPVVARAHPGRFVGRQRRRGGGRAGGRRDRLRRRGQRPHPGGMDAPGRHQAAAGPHLHLAAARGVQRHHRQRRAGPHRHRRGAGARRRVGQCAGDLHKPPPVRVSDFVAQAPGPLRIALSTKFPFTVFRAKLHPEIRAAMETVAGQLEELGHTIVAADPDYNLRHVVELPVPVHLGAAGLGRPARPRRHAGQAHQVQHPDGPAAVGERAAQGPRPRGRIAAADRVDLQPRRRRAGADDRAAAAARCTISTTAAGWRRTAR